MFPDRLPFVAHPELSLYVHVPFCPVKCDYCDFFSVAASANHIEKQRQIETTVEETIRDLSIAFEAVSSPLRPSIETIYVGGGTPSHIEARVAERLLRTVGSLNPLNLIEYTVEMNPESTDIGWLELAKTAGVTRISLGVQSLDAAVLEYLGRPSSVETNLEALALVAASFPGSFNVDLLTGIPGQSEANLASTVDQVTDFRPSHVSLYELTVEPGTRLQHQISTGERMPPDSDGAKWMSGVELLKASGFDWYEVSSFAKPGKRSDHLLKTWQIDPCVGIGPGAVSTMGTRSGPVRLECDRKLAGFEYRSTELSPSEFLLEHLMMGLRSDAGVSIDRIGSIFGLDLSRLLVGEVVPFMERDELRLDRGRLLATESGRMVLDSILVPLARNIDGIEVTEVHWPS